MVCGGEEEIELFEGFCVPELEWMILWVILVFIPKSFGMNDPELEWMILWVILWMILNSPCFSLLRGRLASFCLVTRVGPRWN
jgi:hypothetical protein